MKKLVRALAIATAIGAPAIISIAPSAQAANADVAVIRGAGTISPGLTATPQPQSVSFGGNDLDGSYAEGAGTVSGSCGPISLSLCVFVRVGGAVPVACVGTGTPKQGAAGVFGFVPNQTPPSTVTSYTLAGAALYADV